MAGFGLGFFSPNAAKLCSVRLSEWLGNAIWALPFENEIERARLNSFGFAHHVCLAESSKIGCQLRPVLNTSKRRCVAYISQALLNQQTNQRRMKGDLAKLTARRSTPARSAKDKHEIQTLEMPLFFATANLTCSMHGDCAVKMMNLLVSMCRRLGGPQNGYDLWHRLFFSTSPVRIGDGRAHLLLRGLTLELTGVLQRAAVWRE